MTANVGLTEITPNKFNEIYLKIKEEKRIKIWFRKISKYILFYGVVSTNL